MTETHALSDREWIETPLKYLANRDGRAGYVASTGGGDITEHQGQYRTVTVPIYNARLENKQFSLDEEGFMLADHHSAVADFYSDAEITELYEPEINTLLREKTGAQRIEIFDHTRRASSIEVQKKRMIREPASIIHNDYSARSAPNRLRDHCRNRPDAFESLMKRRFAIVNVWRSIAGEVVVAPLTFCDASSTCDEDLVPVTRQAKDRVGEIQLATHNPSHCWYYFPRMQPSEVALFKTYDSETNGKARFTLHTAFDDPAAPLEAPPRESIETRCFVFF